MRTVSSVSTMQKMARAWKRQRLLIGFVPTMGYLHRGHLSLIERARRLVGPRGKVVVSIFVNPTQFAPGEDFSRYPRDLARDNALCRDAGADVVFTPSDTDMYSRRGDAPFSTYVVEETLSEIMEGASRPGHFRGVTTVVAKLFNIVLPDMAVFGAKDFQQAAIVRRMVRDLNFPLRLVIARTQREEDGLAMSSRNKYLTGELRAQAVVLWQAIRKARAAVESSSAPVKATRLKAQLRRFIEAEPAARVDYIEFFEPATLQGVATVRRGVQMALAVYIGKTRLIDNARL